MDGALLTEEIIYQELNSPFVYLKSIMDKHQISINNGSSWDQYRPHAKRIHPNGVDLSYVILE